MQSLHAVVICKTKTYGYAILIRLNKDRRGGGATRTHALCPWLTRVINETHPENLIAHLTINIVRLTSSD